MCYCCVTGSHKTEQSLPAFFLTKCSLFLLQLSIPANICVLCQIVSFISSVWTSICEKCITASLYSLQTSHLKDTRSCLCGLLLLCSSSPGGFMLQHGLCRDTQQQHCSQVRAAAATGAIQSPSTASCRWPVDSAQLMTDS